jgi:transcriptional regulator with XRE-family HTH domain
MNDIEMLRRIKERKGYTLDEMARAMGVTLRTIFRWLHKENEPSPMAKEKINSYIHAESVKEHE